MKRLSSLMNSDSHADLVSRILGTLLEPPGMCTTVKCWADAQGMYSGRKEDEIPLQGVQFSGNEVKVSGKPKRRV